MTALTAEKLREKLDYCRLTGNFYWRKSHKSISAGDVAGSKNGQGYVYITIAGKKHLAHRLAWLYVHGRWPDALLDHKDRDRSNNRFLNLREASHSESSANRGCRSDSITGLKGVKHQGSGFCANIKDAEGVCRYLGQFETPEAAHDAYVNAAKRIYGEFAIENSITKAVSGAS